MNDPIDNQQQPSDQVQVADQPQTNAQATVEVVSRPKLPKRLTPKQLWSYTILLLTLEILTSLWYVLIRYQEDADTFASHHTGYAFGRALCLIACVSYGRTMWRMWDNNSKHLAADKENTRAE